MSLLKLLKENPDQAVLEILRELSLPVLRDYSYPTRIQIVKEGLFARDFVRVFGDPQNLGVYCMRWVPPRALAYLNLFTQDPIIMKLLCNDVRICAVGAGAGSELVAVGTVMAMIQYHPKYKEAFRQHRKGNSSQQLQSTKSKASHNITLNCIDFGEWLPFLQSAAHLLEDYLGVKTTCRLWAAGEIKGSSAKVEVEREKMNCDEGKEATKDMGDGSNVGGSGVERGGRDTEGEAGLGRPSHDNADDHRGDKESCGEGHDGVPPSFVAPSSLVAASVLEPSLVPVASATSSPAAGVDSGHAPAPLLNLVFNAADVQTEHATVRTRLDSLYSSSHIIMACFVVNELFADKGKALATLGHLVSQMRRGAFLYVVDSASDLSLMDINGSKYWVWMLIDGLKGLRKVSSQDSHWHRLDSSLKYPIALENVHCYVRLYQKI